MSCRLRGISLATAIVVVILATGSSAALGLPRATASSARSATTGVVVVNTRLYGGAAAGTGIVLSSSGEVLTNNHVIRGATAIQVKDVSSGRTYTATVTGYSVAKDVALLKLRNAHDLQTAVIGSSSDLEVGDRVTAVGNAGGTGVLTTKSGKLTSLARSITVSDDGGTTRLKSLIETSAALRPGDSGGPLLLDGRVVGMDAAASLGGWFQSTGGPGYAIPIDSALGIARQIRGGRTSSTVHVGPTAFLGVSLAQATAGRDISGVVVQDVVPGSPADTAGVGADDVITSFGGQRVSTAARLKNLVLRLSPGRSVRLGWVDDFQGPSSALVRLAAGPPQ